MTFFFHFKLCSHLPLSCLIGWQIFGWLWVIFGSIKIILVGSGSLLMKLYLYHWQSKRCTKHIWIEKEIFLIIRIKWSHILENFFLCNAFIVIFLIFNSVYKAYFKVSSEYWIGTEMLFTFLFLKLGSSHMLVKSWKKIMVIVLFHHTRKYECNEKNCYS